jgi:ElaB/YqjD/DUF883 family membrane-anchored ribosome-binding protein
MDEMAKSHKKQVSDLMNWFRDLFDQKGETHRKELQDHRRQTDKELNEIRRRIQELSKLPSISGAASTSAGSEIEVEES